MAISYSTKFKSANSFVITIWGLTAKFNSRQYFWLYGILCIFGGVYLLAIVRKPKLIYIVR